MKIDLKNNNSMIYKGKKLTHNDFNEEVTGQKKTYNCWSFSQKELENITECNNFILLESYRSPIVKNNKIISFKRNYISIVFYKNFNDFIKKSDDLNYDSAFIIPTSTEFKSEILIDIKKKHGI